jgi:hypothetical protein
MSIESEIQKLVAETATRLNVQESELALLESQLAKLHYRGQVATVSAEAGKSGYSEAENLARIWEKLSPGPRTTSYQMRR